MKSQLLNRQLQEIFAGGGEERLRGLLAGIEASHGDLARGTGHFRVSLAKGQELLRRLRGNYSGLCQPDYLIDLPGGHGKVSFCPAFTIQTEEGWLLEDFKGQQHAYRDILPDET